MRIFMMAVAATAFCLGPTSAEDGSGFYITPYLQNVTPDGITIMWETPEAGVGRIEFGIDGRYARSVTETEAVKIHEVR